MIEQSWLRMSVIGLAALVAGWGVWLLMARPQALAWVRRPHQAAPRREPRDRPLREMQPWLVLLPSRWARWGVRRLQWIVAVSLGVVTWEITANGVATTAFAWMGFVLPEIVLRDAAWLRWTELDRAAYVTAYNVRFYLEQGLSVLDAWRAVTPRSKPVFQRWIAPCLLAESDADQPAFEAALKEKALAIRHTELSVCADVMGAERRHGSAVGSLVQLLALWGKRIELDADRRGSLVGFVWISRGTLGTGIALFWGLCLGDPAIRAHIATPMGRVVAGLSAVLLALGMLLYARQSRLAERF